MGQLHRIINDVIEYDMNTENMFAYHRCMGMEPKNRKRIHANVEKEFLEILEEKTSSQKNLSDAINKGLNLYFVSCGWIK